MKKMLVIAAFLSYLMIATFTSAQQAEDSESLALEALGRALFFDVNLSNNRSQSCATCHSPDYGFVDPRSPSRFQPFSLGDDGKSLGNRNAPTAAYAAYTPRFHQNEKGVYIGGQFLDGRETALEGQAGGPPLNPLEMAMPSKLSVVQRLLENPTYQQAFVAHFGESIFDDTNAAYDAMKKSIAAFERTELFAPFDSKYDRYLRGKYKMTERETLGMTLFFSQQFTNCNLCHQLRKLPESNKETFSNYEYHNIGVPPNNSLRLAHTQVQDIGLLAHPNVTDDAQKGKFKTPTLRNIAVTAPYMHNGVFDDLRTVIAFYNKYNSKSAKRQINPETNEPWGDPEVVINLSIKELETGPALDEKRIDALVSFLKMLTDKRYEHLISVP